MAAPVSLDYGVYAGGFQALSAAVTIADDAAHYQVDIKAKTAGTIGALFPWTIDLTSHGNVADGKLQPIEHAQTSNFQGKDRSVLLDYDGHGGFITRKTIPDAHEDLRDEVPPDQTRDTLDIISAVLAGLLNIDRNGNCAGRVPVFDGRRRFDLIYSDDGHETLEPSEQAIFKGDAMRCAIRVEPIAGYWRKNQKKWFTQKVNGEDEVVPIEVYVGRVGPDRTLVPVRVESTSPFGAIVVHLQDVRGDPPRSGG